MCFFLCVINIYGKNAWVIPLKNKKELQILMLFRKCYMNQNANQIKIWVDKGSEFYNRSMKSFFQNSDVEM